MASLDHKQFEDATPVAHARHRRGEGLEYRVYFTLIFAASLPIAAVRVLIPSARRRAFGVSRERRTIWGEAKVMANIVTPLIFSV
ncbi:hypothetical protein FHS89_000073 [Rubricella aquisinus]|uniref:Protein pufQ n=1 Tax=Rubricella aquisinus TaxID=2028108 RepID=A0A840WWJ0_9RHOB|nr:cytochrome PufQ [Rubricella aquisinus]MBB5514075.1 hypothetical protein [Rubricella aquisinus]